MFNNYLYSAVFNIYLYSDVFNIYLYSAVFNIHFNSAVFNIYWYSALHNAHCRFLVWISAAVKMFTPLDNPCWEVENCGQWWTMLTLVTNKRVQRHLPSFHKITIITVKLFLYQLSLLVKTIAVTSDFINIFNIWHCHESLLRNVAHREESPRLLYVKECMTCYMSYTL